MSRGNVTLIGSLHPLVSDWARRVAVNGGSLPRLETLHAHDRFVKTLVRENVLSKITACCTLSPNSLIEAITPLVVGNGLNPWTNVNFVSGDLTVAGLKGNGSNKYLRIGVNWNTLGNTVGLVVYYPEALASGATPMEIGVGNTTLNRYVYLRGFSTGYNEFGYGGTASANAVNTPSTEHGALQIGSRNGDDSGFLTYERQGSFVENNFVPAGGWAVDNTPFTLFCRNGARNGTYSVADYSARRISFAAITAGLTKTDGRALYQALYTLRGELGGGAV